MDRLLRFCPRLRQPRRSRRLAGYGAVLVAASFIGACFDFGQGTGTDGGATAETSASLGRYDVTATLVSQSCGTGKLGFPDTLTFAVALDAPEGDALTWGDGADELTGKRTDGGASFTVTAETVVDARAGSTNENAPPCKIERTDVVKGELDDPEAPTSFEADLTVDYAAVEGSDCRDLLFGPDRLAQALPCKARYSLAGAKQEAGAEP